MRITKDEILDLIFTPQPGTVNDFEAYFSASGQTLAGSESIPEPVTLILFGSGLLGLAGVRKKISKNIDSHFFRKGEGL